MFGKNKEQKIKDLTITEFQEIIRYTVRKELDAYREHIKTDYSSAIKDIIISERTKDEACINNPDFLNRGLVALTGVKKVTKDDYNVYPAEKFKLFFGHLNVSCQAVFKSIHDDDTILKILIETYKKSSKTNIIPSIETETKVMKPTKYKLSKFKQNTKSITYDKAKLTIEDPRSMLVADFVWDFKPDQLFIFEPINNNTNISFMVYDNSKDKYWIFKYDI